VPIYPHGLAFKHRGWINPALRYLPLTDLLRTVLEGSGECAEKGIEVSAIYRLHVGWMLVVFPSR